MIRQQGTHGTKAPAGAAIRLSYRIVLPALLLSAAMASSALCGAPLNDDCQDAAHVGDGIYMASNTGATNDGEASCGFQGVEGGADLWFRYVAHGMGTVTADTCSTTQLLFDTLISVFDACNGNEITCNDDALVPSCLTLSRVEFPVTAGTSYWIRVAEYRDRSGTFTLTISSDLQNQCADGFCAQPETPDSCPADCATLINVAGFQICFSGDAPGTQTGCEAMDFDSNDRVNLADFAHFAAYNFVGPQ